MVESTWVHALNDGDKVIVRRHGIGERRASVETVRVTPTQVVVGSLRFNRHTGSPRGTFGYYRPRLEPYTEEAALQIRLTMLKHHAQRALENLTPDTLPIEQCQQVHQALMQLMQVLERSRDDTEAPTP